MRLTLDDSIVGLTSAVNVVDVERGHIRKFAEAIGDKNRLYLDDDYAASTPFGSIIAPPTFPVALSSEGGELPLDLDYSRMLHGSQEFIYYRPIKLGNRLYCQMKVVDLYDRKGKSGNMQFLVLDTEMKDEAGEMVAINRMTIIYRGSEGE